ncbi:MAG: aminotransferase class IV [Gammaproteobacteria bacterium]
MPFSTDPSVRVKPAEEYLFVVFTLPFGSYYAAPVDALVAEHHVRSFPGGTGSVKAAGNYSAALIADLEARRQGCSIVMWLDGLHHKQIEECGVMNVFFVLDDVVVTPSLNGTILPGVTRDSAITVLREMGFTVEERSLSIDEVVSAHERGTLRECFGTGTAATLTHVRRIRYRNRDFELPAVETQGIGTSVRKRLIEIATGQIAEHREWLEIL